jgi:hypothetical protein
MDFGETLAISTHKVFVRGEQEEMMALEIKLGHSTSLKLTYFLVTSRAGLHTGGDRTSLSASS